MRSLALLSFTLHPMGTAIAQAPHDSYERGFAIGAGVGVIGGIVITAIAVALASTVHVPPPDPAEAPALRELQKRYERQRAAAPDVAED